MFFGESMPPQQPTTTTAFVDAPREPWVPAGGGNTRHAQRSPGRQRMEIEVPIALPSLPAGSSLSSSVRFEGVGLGGLQPSHYSQADGGLPPVHGATGGKARVGGGGGVIRPRRVGSAPVKRGAGGAYVPSGSVESLTTQLAEARSKETVLQAELLALKTRRRQREGRALAASKLASSTANSAESSRLKDELIHLQKQRDLLSDKTRELQSTKMRVRTRDLKTLALAKNLVNPHGIDLEAEARSNEEEAVLAAQAQVDRLQRRQRELLISTQKRRATLERELVEERVLRDALADAF